MGHQLEEVDGSSSPVRTRCTSCRLLAVQFGLLLWKNILLQIRRPLGTLFEITIPLVTVSVLIILRFSVFQLTNNCFVTYNSDPLVIPTIDPYIIYYAPNTTEVNDFANNYMAPLLVASGGSVEGVATSDDIYSAVTASNTSRTRGCFLGGAGVYFNEFSGNDIQFSIRLRYVTSTEGQWRLDSIGATLELAGPRHVPYFYFDEGFMQLQKIVSEAIIHYRTNQPVTLNVETRQIPSPTYARDFFVFSLNLLLPFLIGISFVYSAGIFVKELVLEKESRTREVMKIMGLSNWVLWITWFLKEFVFLMSIGIIVSIMLKFGLILVHSNLLLIILFFVLFVTSGIAFCFLLSAFFSSATLGILAGVLVWAGLYLIHFFLNSFYDSIPFVMKFFLSLLSSNICTGFGIQIISKLEQAQRGINYNTFYTPVSFNDTTFNMSWVFLILSIDTVLYMILYWYIDAVFPGQYGIKKPPYFFLLPSYWTGKKCQYKRTQQANIEEIQMEALNDDHEIEPTGLPVGISINNLTKIFNPRSSKSRVVAVSNMSLKLYKGQITALLGHNGAGKTTTMNILVGFYAPTSGNACIDGLNIVDDLDLIRHNLGLCPQHNILFDRLTVLEHLKFYIRLKGVTEDIMDEIEDMIEDLELDDKADVQSQNLSGGMKRKLSVAIALIGGSKFVILDEPTSGMDPYTRRITWDLLIKHKQGRTILLTTQFMDEADILGDRVAIMKAGNVKTSGSSLFLKKRYGIGYHLTIEKSETSIDSEDIITLVSDMVTSSKFLYDIGTEVSILLPDENSHQFPSLLDTLEAKKSDLGINSFGVSVTTMEEVFIQVGKGEDEVIERKIERRKTLLLREQSQASIPQPEVTETDHDVLEDYEGYNTGLVLQLQQFWAMLIKHFYYFTRFWLGIIFSIVLPLASVLLALLVAKFDSSSTSVSTLSLNLTLPQLAEEANNITFFWANFGSNFPITFGADNTSVLQATNFFDFTSDIETIISSVQNVTSVSDCCNYQYQVLDKYCASRSIEELGVCANTNFGYSLCMNCLSCCVARRNKIPSCTDPTAESLYPSSDVFCPAPPVLSLSDRTSTTPPTGPIDDVNTYVAERLLHYSTEISIGVFESIFQGGFVLHSSPVSAYSTCGCDNTTETCHYLTPALLTSAINAPSVTFTNVSSFLTDFCSAFNESTSNCHLLPVQSWNQQYSGTLGVCIDESSCNVNQYQCQCSNASQCQYGRTAPDISSTRQTATVWYNHKAYHTAPIVLNSFYNMYLKSINSSLSLSITNQPFPAPLINELIQLTASSLQVHSITVSITIGIGFSFLYASIVILLTKEKEEKSKHLQFVGGVHSGAYWLSSYIKDGLINLFVITVSMIFFGAIQVRGFTGTSLGAVFLLMLLSTWTCHSVAYICTFIFTNSLIGFTILFILLAFPATIMNAIIYILIEGRQLDINLIDIIHYVFTLHPVYGLSSGLFNMYNNGATKQTCSQSAETALVCQQINARFADDIFQLAVPGIGHILIVLAIEAIIATVLVFVLEKGFFLQEVRQLISRRQRHDTTTITVARIEEDKDISAEKAAVSQVTNLNDHSVVIRNLVKEYQSVAAQVISCYHGSTKLAVNDINLIINKGECFGLLGVNGAGKTTTFKMLTGDIPISSGSAIVAGYNVSSQLRSAQQHMGYCPQFDSLIELMTGRELLTMFARLKGIKEKDIPGEVETEIKRLNLVDYADKRCGTYSGGNKRKLSTAIALVGRPPIVFLDEPTTGMDPVTRRFVWNAITGIIREGRSVILTTHSMEECDALCTKLTIMVNGSLKAIGSVQHLKSRYSSGYLLQVKVGLRSAFTERRKSLRASRRKTRRERKTIRQQERKDVHGKVERALSADDQEFEREISKGEVRQTGQISGTLKRKPSRLARLISRHSSQKLVEDDNGLEIATERTNAKIIEYFPSSSLVEKYLGHLTYELPSEDISWSTVFSKIEDNKHDLGIVDYSVSQPTLEKVFLGFAKAQQ